jgi:hypothetical protein
MTTRTYFKKICSKHPELNGERYIANRQCVTCCIENAKRRAIENPEKHLEQSRRWRALNPEKTKEQTRKSVAKNRKENREVHRERSRQWATLHPEKTSARNAARKARQLKATPKWANTEVIKTLYEIASIYRSNGIIAHVDHIVPLKNPKVCGLHVEHNLTLLPAVANHSKGNRWWPEM